MCERRDKSTRKQHRRLSFSLSIKFKAKKKKIAICSVALVQKSSWSFGN